MTQEIIDRANELKYRIECYEIVIRYAAEPYPYLYFVGIIGNSNLSDDKELAKLIYDHCKQKQKKLIDEYDKL